MKKIILTLAVVLTLVLTTTLVSIAAPDDIPDAFGPASAEPPVEYVQPADN